MKSIEIINKDNLSLDYINFEIAQVEQEKGRRVRKVEFIDNGDGTSTQRFWFEALPTFSRLRRVTGYIGSTLDRMNNAKQAEVRDRVKHTV